MLNLLSTILHKLKNNSPNHFKQPQSHGQREIIYPVCHAKLGFSRIFFFMLLAIYGGAIGILCFLNIPFWLNIVLMLLCSLHLIYLIFHHLYRLTPDAIIELSADPFACWWLIRSNRPPLEARLRGDSYVTNFLLILNFDTKAPDIFPMRPSAGAKALSVFVFKDAISPSSWHQLRFCLSASR